MEISQMSRDYLSVESVLQLAREQRESVKCKETPFRVEFRYPRGSKSYKYFTDFESAFSAKDVKAGYSPNGRAHFERPLSQQVQVKGPRGGWKRRG